jgi:hypothetical protein
MTTIPARHGAIVELYEGETLRTTSEPGAFLVRFHPGEHRSLDVVAERVVADLDDVLPLPPPTFHGVPFPIPVVFGAPAIHNRQQRRADIARARSRR